MDYLYDPKMSANKNHREQLEYLKSKHSDGPSLVCISIKYMTSQVKQFFGFEKYIFQDGEFHVWPSHVLVAVRLNLQTDIN